MKLVVSWGVVFKLTDAKYKRMLKDAAAGKDIEASNYGTTVGAAVDVTNYSTQWAKDLLDNMKEAAERKREKKL